MERRLNQALRIKKNYILREIPKTLCMDFGLLYENDKGECVLLNDVRMADIRHSSLVYFSTYYVPIALFASKQAVSITLFGPRPNNKRDARAKLLFC